MAEPFVKKTYYVMTLDPVHVGTGGYRLGRVDNTITREPGTNLPKIPGSTISGVTRAYTAMAVQCEITAPVWEQRNSGIVLDQQQYKKMKYLRPLYKFANKENLILVSDVDKKPVIERDKDGNEIYYSCAGKGVDDGEGHCGEPDCEVCVPFGFSKGKSGSSFQGLAQFFDARILFFPVHSMIGPVWVTSCSSLRDFQESLKTQSGVIFHCEPDLVIEDETKVITNLKNQNDKLNLGWLYLQNLKKANPVARHNLQLDSTIIDRLVVVSDNLFSRIVNDNLEVRTSVAIDPATGAAESRALYTYEAIPRATVMWFDVVYNKPEFFRVDGKEIMINPTIRADVNWIKTNVENGLNYFESLGVGGMGTRGMGRMRVLNLGGQ